MKFIYGTTNQGKINYMNQILENLDIEIIGINEYKLEQIRIEESGDTPLENAKIKAEAYYNIVKKPVFSCDSGLYIKGLPDELQPGVHVRRVGGKELSDEEMITHYSNLAKQTEGDLKAQYRNAIYLIMGEDHIYQYDGEDIASVEFIMSKIPHKNRVKGLPLNSLSVDLKTRNYFMDLGSNYRKDEQINSGFRNFFSRVFDDYNKR